MISRCITVESSGSAETLPTTLLLLSCGSFRRATVTIENPDLSQILDVVLYRRTTRNARQAVSDFDGFRNIGPDDARCKDIDIEGIYDLEFRASASGGGIDPVNYWITLYY